MLTQIKEWFNRAVPNPTDKNRAVQIGCHFEEVGEMFDAMQECRAAERLRHLSSFYKSECAGLAIDAEGVDRKELLDSLCDQIVTAVGVGHMFGLDVLCALAEVNRSNWSKFVDGQPVFDENGKIKKGPDYKAPDLTPYL